eukprot:COSAG02_NODE_57953_length_279_cov_0.566667_1_plen_92_part_11
MNRFPYICSRKFVPSFATGGEMLGCAGGRWVLGAPYKRPTKSRIRLAPTIVPGMYEPEVFADINATRALVNATVTTPYECAALVYREFPGAN